jgi:hypothetical protein
MEGPKEIGDDLMTTYPNPWRDLNGPNWQTDPQDNGDPTWQPDLRPWTTITWTHDPADFSPRPEPPKIPYAGIRTGEIEGWRSWRVVYQAGVYRLRSLFAPYYWEPGWKAEGDVDMVVDAHPMAPIMGGIYCYKSVKSIKHVHIGGPLVTGRIQLWGEVVEHQEGWRGQFAKIIDLNKIYPYTDYAVLEELRFLYLGGNHVPQKTHDSRSWTGREIGPSSDAKPR